MAMYLQVMARPPEKMNSSHNSESPSQADLPHKQGPVAGSRLLRISFQMSCYQKFQENVGIKLHKFQASQRTALSLFFSHMVQKNSLYSSGCVAGPNRGEVNFPIKSLQKAKVCL